MSYSFEQVGQLVNKLKKMGWDPERVTALGQATQQQFRAIEQILDGKTLEQAIHAAVSMKVDVVGRNTSFLRLLPGAEALPLSACDGTRTVAQAKDVFRSYIDSDFTNWKLDVAGVATPAGCMQVRELVKNATFRQMFTSLSSDLDKLVMSQHQITVFCQEHREWLQQDGYATFFLFKENGEFFVARVDVYSDGLNVRVDRFGYDNVWGAENRYHIVSPQLDPENLIV